MPSKFRHPSVETITLVTNQRSIKYHRESKVQQHLVQYLIPKISPQKLKFMYCITYTHKKKIKKKMKMKIKYVHTD